LAAALAADVSLMAELDDLHRPSGPLLAAQRAAARLYGADRSFFAVNGTTGALQAMLLGVLEPEARIVLARNAHRAAAGALVLTGARPVYIQPGFDDEFGVATQPEPQAVAAGLRQAGRAAAVLLTSPNYYGLSAQTRRIAELAHAAGALLLVDEAHGAHLGFHPRLPEAALAAGADAAAQSTHKLLGALTQASLLHIKGTRLDGERIARSMSLLTTTSPNQLLLASLDAVCGQLARDGRAMLDRAVELAEYMRDRIGQIAGLRVWPAPDGEKPLLDLTKVTVNVAALGLTGFAAAEFLRRRRIAVELADPANILYIITYADEQSAIDDNIAALRELARSGRTTGRAVVCAPPPAPGELVLTPREAFFRPREAAPLKRAAGRIAAQALAFYPPGVPFVLPGEVITAAAVEYAQSRIALGDNQLGEMVSVVR
jgi:arginine/lysine/ornithine decarboxylase